MPPEYLDSLWALALWVMVALLLPKRDWRTLGVRIRVVAAGRRLHTFGAPRLAHPGNASGSDLWRLLRAEAPRLLELGVPAWLASVFAEKRGTVRRRAEEARWRRTPAGLLDDHLHDRLSRRDLHKKLLDFGFPLPAAKAQRTVRRAYTMPPMAWLRESQREEAGVSESKGVVRGVAKDVQAVSKPKLEVQTLGTLRVVFCGEDLTARLLKRPTVAFIWQYGLVRAICAPDSPVSRDSLADELYARLDLETQRARLRHRLYDVQQVLQGALSTPIKIEASSLRFDLDVCQVDVIQMLELARRCEGAEGLLSPSSVVQVSAALATASGEFLPDWEDLEQSVTGGRGTAGETVRELRHRVQTARVSLLVGLGDHYLAVRDPGRAAIAFEEAFALQPDRANLIRRLADALDGAGQRSRAIEIRRTHQEGDSFSS